MHYRYFFKSWICHKMWNVQKIAIFFLKILIIYNAYIFGRVLLKSVKSRTTPDICWKRSRTAPDALKKRTVSGEKRTDGNPSYRNLILTGALWTIVQHHMQTSVIGDEIINLLILICMWGVTPTSPILPIFTAEHKPFTILNRGANFNWNIGKISWDINKFSCYDLFGIYFVWLLLNHTDKF